MIETCGTAVFRGLIEGESAKEAENQQPVIHRMKTRKTCCHRIPSQSHHCHHVLLMCPVCVLVCGSCILDQSGDCVSWIASGQKSVDEEVRIVMYRQSV